MPDYQHTRGAIYVVVPVGEGKLRLRAEAVRKERTGIHSRIEIWWEKQRLTYDQFNVERQEERRRLMRGAYKLLPSEAKELITEDQAIMELDMFCADLWAAHVGSIEVDVEMPGDINIPPPRMMGPYVIEEGGCIIHGQPGSGKSWCLYCILQSINHGCSAIWPVRKQERVLLVNLERSAKSVQQRMGCVNRTLGLPLDAPMDILNLRGHSLKDAADAARNHCEKYGVTVLGLDSISRAGLGSLNRDEVANEVIDLMNSICPTWIALGHQAKPDPENGGSATNFGCHSEDTEVLSEYGWARHSMLRPNDEVAMFNPATGNLEWGPVQAVHEYDYDGEMIHLGGQTQDILVTPNHRMVVKTLTRAGADGVWSNDWAFTTAEELKANSRVPYAAPFVNRGGDIHTLMADKYSLPADAFLRYLGWWISEGCCVGNSPVITQAQGVLADEMVSVVDELGLPYHVGQYDYKYPGREHELPIQQLAIRGSRWLADTLKDNCGNLAPNKKLPWFTWLLSERQKRLLFDSLMEGDGSWDKARPTISRRQGGAGGAGRYTTTSRQLADGVQRLAIELGYSAVVKSRLGAKAHHHDQITVFIGNRSYIGIHARLGHIKRVPYSGKVYCLTVPTGAYLTRRNGTTAITGNSQMFYAGADMMVRLESEPIWNGNLNVTMTIDKANVLVDKQPAHFLYEMDAVGLSRVSSGPSKQVTVQQVLDCLAGGSNWAGSVAAQLDIDRGYVSSIFRSHPELFTHVFTDDEQRDYYSAA